MENEKLKITPKPLKGEDGYKVFSVRVKTETISAIDQISNQTGRSRNELIGIFLDYAAKNHIITD